MRIFAFGLLAIVLVAPACTKTPTPSPVDAAASAAESPSAAQTFRPRPEDLDLVRAREPHKCAPNSKKPVCMGLADFEKADAWNLETIRGVDARYFGLATVIEKGVTRSGYFFLIVKKVPTNEVPVGDLAIRVALRELESGLKAENQQAPKLQRALERDDAVGKGNTTIQYLKTYAPSTWDGANVTAGPSTIMHSEGGVYVRESKNRKLQVVRLAAGTPDAVPGDGMVATLYPVSW
jgi:hypothetical protein